MKLHSLFVLGLSLTTSAFALAPKKFADVAKIKPVTVTAGKSGEAVVTLNVIKGFHIQANPASNPSLIATTLSVTDPAGLAPGNPEYPPGKPYHSVATGTDVMAYEGKVSVKLPIAIGTAKPGSHEVAAKVRYQACNDETCYFPVTAEIKIPVTVK